jgi:hypothetical protein
VLGTVAMVAFGVATAIRVARAVRTRAIGFPAHRANARGRRYIVDMTPGP